MSRRNRAIKRVVRGELPRPGSYWTAFLVLSFITHSLILVVLSGAAESFIESLPRPQPAKEILLYVGLVFQKPVPLPETQGVVRIVQPDTAVKQRRIRETALPASGPKPVPMTSHAEPDAPKPQPVMKAAVSIPPMPFKQSQTHTENVPSRPAAPAPMLAAKDDTSEISVIGEKTAKPATVNSKAAAEPVSETPKPDTSAADRKYVEFFEQDDGAVTVVKGIDTTTVPASELAPPVPAPVTDKPVIRPLPEPPAPPAVEAVPEPEPLGVHSIVAAPAPLQIVPAIVPVRLESILTGTAPDGNAPSAGYITSGIPLISAEKNGITAKAVLLAMLWDIKDRFVPGMDSRPSPVIGPLASEDVYAEADSGLAPVTTVERINEPVPSADAVKQALPEPVLRMAPKVIEIAENPVIIAAPPEITITKPVAGDIDRSLVKVEGEVSGEGIGSVILTIGDAKKELLVSDGRFSTEVVLEEGRNVLTASGLDSYDRTARTRVVVNYVPAQDNAIISFITPRNGGIIDALERKEIEISGTAKGIKAGSVRVYLNKTITDVPVVDGAFRFKTLLQAEGNTLYAEAVGSNGRTYRSPDISFRVVNLFPKDITVQMKTGGAQGVELTHSWRPHPLSNEGARPDGPDYADSATADGPVTEVETAPPGIYTVGASYDIPSGQSASVTFVVTLYGYDPAKKTTRSIGPVKLSGRGKLPAVRLLMPERVFWEDDYWFSGVIESSSGTTKFRQPEGITWHEDQ